jgi:hypothetical protein
MPSIYSHYSVNGNQHIALDNENQGFVRCVFSALHKKKKIDGSAVRYNVALWAVYVS